MQGASHVRLNLLKEQLISTKKINDVQNSTPLATPTKIQNKSEIQFEFKDAEDDKDKDEFDQQLQEFKKIQTKQSAPPVQQTSNSIPSSSSITNSGHKTWTRTPSSNNSLIVVFESSSDMEESDENSSNHSSSDDESTSSLITTTQQQQQQQQQWKVPLNPSTNQRRKRNAAPLKVHKKKKKRMKQSSSSFDMSHPLHSLQIQIRELKNRLEQKRRTICDLDRDRILLTQQLQYIQSMIEGYSSEAHQIHSNIIQCEEMLRIEQSKSIKQQLLLQKEKKLKQTATLSRGEHSQKIDSASSSSPQESSQIVNDRLDYIPIPKDQTILQQEHTKHQIIFELQKLLSNSIALKKAQPNDTPFPVLNIQPLICQHNNNNNTTAVVSIDAESMNTSIDTTSLLPSVKLLYCLPSLLNQFFNTSSIPLQGIDCNPMDILCFYEIQGKCSNTNCTYQHLSKYECKYDQLWTFIVAQYSQLDSCHSLLSQLSNIHSKISKSILLSQIKKNWNNCKQMIQQGVQELFDLVQLSEEELVSQFLNNNRSIEWIDKEETEYSFLLPNLYKYHWLYYLCKTNQQHNNPILQHMLQPILTQKSNFNLQLLQQQIIAQGLQYLVPLMEQPSFLNSLSSSHGKSTWFLYLNLFESKYNPIVTQQFDDSLLKIYMYLTDHVYTHNVYLWSRRLELIQKLSVNNNQFVVLLEHSLQRLKQHISEEWITILFEKKNLPWYWNLFFKLHSQQQSVLILTDYFALFHYTESQWIDYFVSYHQMNRQELFEHCQHVKCIVVEMKQQELCEYYLQHVNNHDYQIWYMYYCICEDKKKCISQLIQSIVFDMPFVTSEYCTNDYMVKEVLENVIKQSMDGYLYSIYHMQFPLHSFSFVTLLNHQIGIIMKDVINQPNNSHLYIHSNLIPLCITKKQVLELQNGTQSLELLLQSEYELLKTWLQFEELSVYYFANQEILLLQKCYETHVITPLLELFFKGNKTNYKRMVLSEALKYFPHNNYLQQLCKDYFHVEWNMSQVSLL